MTTNSNTMLILYLAGIMIIYTGIDLGAKGVDPFSAGAILVPLYGIVVGLFALLSIDGRKKGSVKKYMVLSLFIMMIIISVLALNAKGLSYSKTGIPALIICALIAHKMSTMVHS